MSELPKNLDELKQEVLKHYRYLAQLGKARKLEQATQPQYTVTPTIAIPSTANNMITNNALRNKGIIKWKFGKVKYVHKYLIVYKPQIAT
jgi:hypothetical protein